MNRKKALALYLLGALGQIWIICIVVLVLRSNGINADYTTPVGMTAICVGGISSALWGIVIAVKYKKYSIKKILKDYFNVKQKFSDYLLVLLFLSLDFCYVLFDGKFQIGAWYVPALLFLKAIIFGGIEELGWRYMFQPILEERLNYIISTIITFFAWGVWHFSYFYIQGTLLQVQGIEFSVGLLVNCFILSALYIKTNSLWICVMTHSLINVFSQLTIGGNQYVSCICRIFIISIAVVISTKEKKKHETDMSSP